MVAVVAAQVEALGPRLAHAVERRRQHVLAGVLLHVIEAPRPVDRAVARGAPTSSGPSTTCTSRSVVVIDDVDDAPAAERAEVVRLPAGGGIERRADERDREAVAGRGAGGDVGVERLAIGVGVIETVGHAAARESRRGERIEHPGLAKPGLAQPAAVAAPAGAAARIGVVAAVRQAVVEAERRAQPHDVGLRQLRAAARARERPCPRRQPWWPAGPGSRTPG